MMRGVKELHKLQLKLVSARGELLNCVNCFASQISVLRAEIASDLKPYERALAGKPGAEKFIIELDGEPYKPEEQVLIGFGENFIASQQSIADYLKSANCPDAAIESLLITFGIEQRSNLPCANLTRSDERKLRLLAASYSKHKVIVLNDPFEPISVESKEKFAELMLNSVRSRNQIIVVVNLSYRPSCWIDAKGITRIQVGESLQKTVGFGSNNVALKAIIEEVRVNAQKNNLSLATEEKDIKSADYAELNPENIAPQKTSPFVLAALAALIPSSSKLSQISIKLTLTTGTVILIGVGGFLAYKKYSLNETQPVAILNQKLDSLENKQISNTEFNLKKIDQQLHTNESKGKNQKIAEPEIDNKSIAINNKLIQTEEKINYVLDLYPISIKEGVIKTFNMQAINTNNASIKTNYTEEQPNVIKSKEAGELLLLLQSADGTGADLPDSPARSASSNNNYEPPPPNNDPLRHLPPDATEEEKKREIIRQKFLEAIEKAARKKREEPPDPQ
ncbi:MAG TPA: hypothetical protein PKD37_01375 [Oligoflexia bacterium]|nr:hypothetical protein [Oligoflexia bacterium]HMP26627.1 hypothetical protein [Oligoflexia bacterium]